MDHWKGIKKVVVVGLGITGLSVVRHLNRLDRNFDIKVIDTRENPPGNKELGELAALHCGSWNLDWLMEADLIVANPGIALATPELQNALAQGIAIVGDIELFSWAVTAPVIAITGSNGKSTVTDLSCALAKAAGIKVGVGGNIGIPALELLTDPAELYILELSSFQLETTSNLELVAAAFLNLSEDHMDRYDSMESYRKAKLRIFKQAKNIIVNQEDEATWPDTLTDEQTVVSFGLQQGRFSVTTRANAAWLSDNGTPVFPVNELALIGKHNVANALTALALLDCANVDYSRSFEVLKSYTGLTHRCQLVADNRGIKWVNDSKATNVASTLAALSGLNIKGTLHLLVGGIGKGADFSELAPQLAKLPVKLYCFGKDAGQFMSLHSSASRWDAMDDIIAAIAPQLSQGDMVMLSPACASFDQYTNFMARGDAFTRLAKQYA